MVSKYYFTQPWTKDTVAGDFIVVEAPDELSARILYKEHFGMNWCYVYNEETFKIEQYAKQPLATLRTEEVLRPRY